MYKTIMYLIKIITYTINSDIYIYDKSYNRSELFIHSLDFLEYKSDVL